ncbi:hypothetical protein ACGF0D_09630 [Kitasatospora sp. NPDC048298]|uniref:hypothetical protein n=1 Tax=Kitasatospora sp. NPDC048298 TaxID=3364049 RepID=UPI003710B0F8
MVFDLLEQALNADGMGWSSYDERVNRVLKEAGIGLVMIDGNFVEDDEGPRNWTSKTPLSAR